MPTLPKPKRPKYHPKKEQPGNEGANTKLYNSTRWRKHSKAFRRDQTVLREGYGCEVSYHADELAEANVTDHIIPINAGGAIWDRRNHMAMCHHYHNKKRGYERNGLGIAVMRGEDGLIPVDRMDVVRLLLNGRDDEGVGGVNL